MAARAPKASVYKDVADSLPFSSSSPHHLLSSLAPLFVILSLSSPPPSPSFSVLFSASGSALRSTSHHFCRLPELQQYHLRHSRYFSGLHHYTAQPRALLASSFSTTKSASSHSPVHNITTSAFAGCFVGSRSDTEVANEVQVGNLCSPQTCKTHPL